MKKIITSILVCLLISFTACEDFLQLDPPSSPSQAIYWKSKTDFQYALSSCFSVAYDWPGNISQIIPCLDNLTDNSYCAYDEDTYGRTKTMNLGDITPFSNGFVPQMYNLCYKGIGRVHQVMEQLDAYTGKDISDAERASMITQCKALRGYFYYWLYLCYKEVPLVTESLTTDNMYQPKATRAAIKAQIFKDWDEAIAALPSTPYFDKTMLGRFTQGALKGLKARIMMFDAYNDQGVADAAQMAAVIPLLEGITGYTLNPDFRANFISRGQAASQEIMYSVRYLTPNLVNNIDLYFGAWATDMVTRDLVNTFECTDGLDWGVSPLTVPVDETILSKKAETDAAKNEFQKLFVNRDLRLTRTVAHSGWYDFPEPDFPARVIIYNNLTNFSMMKMIAPCTQATAPGYASVNDPDVVIIRYGHILMMIAEAENEANGPTAKAYAAINQIRTRAGQPDLPTGLTKEQFRERVRREWRVETVFEGLRYFQMKQWKLMDKINTYKDPVYKVSSVFKPAFYFWPIPQTEIDKAAGVLVQDPAYN
jgi:starch-binding outer membrane protein, SusD/RagB family